MVLWHSLRESAFSNLVIVHVNHHLRGADSDADADFVKQNADRLGARCEIVEVDAAGFAAERRISIETAGRDLRYAAFSRIARELDCEGIFLAHHADDQAETVLMHLFRGSGARGMSGMSPDSERMIDGTPLRLLRPLLGVTRESIEGYAEQHAIPFRHDASNDSGFCLRNRVRRELIPAISEMFGRDVRASILRAAELAALDETWASEVLASTEVLAEGNSLKVAAMRALPEASRQRLILSWLRASGVPDCGMAEVRRVAEVLMSDSRPAKANLPGGRHVRRRAGLLFIEG